MNYSILSRYRRELMGFATLWVALLHAQMWFSFAPLQWIKMTGHGGVEIFFFLSSFGLYYAWQKGERGFPFVRKRILRILPYAVPAILFRIFYLKKSIGESIQLLTLTSFWITGDRSTWFLSALIIFYALTPVYLHIFQGRERKITIFAVAGSLLLSFLFLDRLQTIFTASIPCYLLGFYAGFLSLHKKRAGRREIVLGSAALLAGFLIQLIAYRADVNDALLYGKGLYWYPFLLMVFPLCMLLAQLIEWCKKTVWMSWLPDVMNRFGIVSLEFYLIHELMIQVWTNVLFVSERYSYHGIILNLVIILITYSISCVWHELTQYLLSLSERGKRHERV